MSRKFFGSCRWHEPSPTEETSFLANSLKRQGVDVISFAQGQILIPRLY